MYEPAALHGSGVRIHAGGAYARIGIVHQRFERRRAVSRFGVCRTDLRRWIAQQKRDDLVLQPWLLGQDAL
jgi:hypothetical protein